MQQWTRVTCAGESISLVSIVADTSEGPNWVGALSILITRRLFHTFICIWRSTLISRKTLVPTNLGTMWHTIQARLQEYTVLKCWPVQLKPSPLYPSLQVQMKDPGVLTQLAFSSQGSTTSHSWISEQYELISQCKCCNTQTSLIDLSTVT